MLNKFVDNAVLLVPETPEEQRQLDTWSLQVDAYVLTIAIEEQVGMRIQPLGLKIDLVRDSLNIVFDKTPAPFNLISNLAPAPFQLDGMHYASVEAYWQGLKFPDEERRARIAVLDRHAARNAGAKAPKCDVIEYKGGAIRVGTYDHWQLMEKACRAKFSQNLLAREALIATGTRTLTHKVAKDSRTIPGVIMADIWMRLRDEIQASRL